MCALFAIARVSKRRILHFTFYPMAEPLSLPDLAALAGYRRQRMNQLFRQGRIPFTPLNHPEKRQARFADTPEMRTWCKSLRPAPVKPPKERIGKKGYFPAYMRGKGFPLSRKRLREALGDFEAWMVESRWMIAEFKKAVEKVPFSKWSRAAQDVILFEWLDPIGRKLGWRVNPKTRQLQISRQLREEMARKRKTL
jgi:hypothetical protein